MRWGNALGFDCQLARSPASKRDQEWAWALDDTASATLEIKVESLAVADLTAYDSAYTMLPLEAAFVAKCITPAGMKPGVPGQLLQEFTPKYKALSPVDVKAQTECPSNQATWGPAWTGDMTAGWIDMHMYI